MARVEILGAPQSTFTRFVRMVCAEKGIDYDLKPMPPHSPEVQAIHPFGKIPAMRHGDLTLCESKAIATYLDRSFPGAKLIPDDPKLAALTEQWISLVNSVMDRTLVRTYLFAYIFPETADGKPDRKAIDAVVPALREQLQLLDKALAKTGFLAGDRLTLADLNLLPILYYVRQFPEGAAALAEAKHLAAYYDRLSARPSFQATTPPPPPAQRAKAN
jgi:glutathione S-transferase